MPLIQVDSRRTAPPRRGRVLDAGSGSRDNTRVHPIFRGWEVVRLDVDHRMQPDLLGSITDMHRLVPDKTFDAVWSSHNIEHLYPHEVPIALREFRRILKPNGYAFITCPDLQQLGATIAKGDIDRTLYQSPAGPITALDILFGHGKSVKQGFTSMAHRTGFTRRSLAALLVDSGFAEVWIAQGPSYALWAVALMPDTDHAPLRQSLSQTAEAFLVQSA